MTLIQEVMDEINGVMGKVKEEQLDQAEQLIQKDRRIFVLGAGRSGLMVKGFAMRLMHIGYTVYVIGETITPSIAPGDVLVAVSGSGTTGSVVEPATKAANNGVAVIGVTSTEDSPLAKISSAVIIVPGATKAKNSVKSMQLLSTLFDQTVHITLDVLALKLSRRDHTSNASAKAAHSNME